MKTRTRTGDPFLRRTEDMRRNHTRRARLQGRKITWSLAQLREHVTRGILAGCPYCGCRLGPETFHGDHARPVSRGGSFALANLVICCGPCNDAKGEMTAPEFFQLLGLIQCWDDHVAARVLQRLRAAGGRFRR